MLRLLLCTLLAAAPAAASPAKKPKKASIEEIISHTLKIGGEYSIDEVRTTAVGIPPGTPAKMIYFPARHFTDQYERLLLVYYQKGKTGPIATTLVWSTAREYKKDEKDVADLWTYRSDLKGRLIGVFHSEAIGETLTEGSAPLDSAMKKKFQAETALFLRDIAAAETVKK